MFIPALPDNEKEALQVMEMSLDNIMDEHESFKD